jgi:hypothetical protein
VRLPITSDLQPSTDIDAPTGPVRLVPDSDMHHCVGGKAGHSHCDSRTVFPQAISGLRKPIAIQAAISFNMNLPE